MTALRDLYTNHSLDRQSERALTIDLSNRKDFLLSEFQRIGVVLPYDQIVEAVSEHQHRYGKSESSRIDIVLTTRDSAIALVEAQWGTLNKEHYFKATGRYASAVKTNTVVLLAEDFPSWAKEEAKEDSGRLNIYFIRMFAENGSIAFELEFSNIPDGVVTEQQFHNNPALLAGFVAQDPNVKNKFLKVPHITDFVTESPFVKLSQSLECSDFIDSDTLAKRIRELVAQRNFAMYYDDEGIVGFESDQTWFDANGLRLNLNKPKREKGSSVYYDLSKNDSNDRFWPNIYVRAKEAGPAAFAMWELIKRLISSSSTSKQFVAADDTDQRNVAAHSMAILGEFPHQDVWQLFANVIKYFYLNETGYIRLSDLPTWKYPALPLNSPDSNDAAEGFKVRINNAKRILISKEDELLSF